MDMVLNNCKNLFRITIPISEVFNSLHYYIIKKRELKIWVEQERNIIRNSEFLSYCG